MPAFSDAEEVYEHIGALIESLVADPDLAAAFHRANTIVRYQYTSPEAQVTVKMLDGEDLRVDLGPSELEPEVVMTMEADTAHLFWLGHVNVTVALARGQIRASGPVAKILKLAPLAKRAFPRYHSRLRAAGRADLIEAPK